MLTGGESGVIIHYCAAPPSLSNQQVWGCFLDATILLRDDLAVLSARSVWIIRLAAHKY